MPKPTDADLVAALKADLNAAWDLMRSRYPAERVYAFGLYTTEDASYFCPFACGEDGLTQVANVYLRKGRYSHLEEARVELKWSIADSPYHEKLPSDRIQAAMDQRPDPLVEGMPVTAVARETRARLNAAVDAMKSLDEEGVFGMREQRARVVLLIEAGDRSDEFVLKLAKKLNPPDVFKNYKSCYEQPSIGRWTEFGTKKVYETNQLSVTADRRLLAIACQYLGCVFDVVSNQQLLCRPIPNKDSYLSLDGVTISRMGEKLAFISGSFESDNVLTVLDGPGWKRQRDVRLPAQPFSLAGASDGAWYAIGFRDLLVRVYGSGNEPVAILEGHEGWPRALAASADGCELASVDDKSGVRIWRTADWSLMREVRSARGTDICFNPAGDRFTTTLQWSSAPDDPLGQILRIWNSREGTLIAEHRVPGFEFQIVRYSPDGSQLACGLEAVDDIHHKEAVLLDAQSGRVLRRLRAPFEWFTDFVFLPARNAIALGVRGHTRRPLVLWELSDAEGQ